ncbi:C40 family peptidase [Candidatus Daviesbacteria bacterium]|nr:C40 family peptidase [Candidatus Daviesbacteria bacterium]
MKIAIPIHFFYIKYNAKQFPGNTNRKGLKFGANCQYFVFELLKHFGVKVKKTFRSSELWEDVVETKKVKRLALFDIVFFNSTEKAYGAHLGVYLEKNKVIHLSRKVGYPTIWDIKEFFKYKEYKYYLGAKRVINKSSKIPNITQPTDRVVG